MIQISIPGFGELNLTRLVIDYNGTLARDGRLIPGAREILTAAARQLEIHVLTADTYGLAAAQLANLPVTLTILPPGGQDEAKQSLVENLGADSIVAVGNGRNDRGMLSAARLGIAVIQKEGAAAGALAAADVVTSCVFDAFELLQHPTRLAATLRS
jgi:soluble P-type ATPase